MTVTQPFYDRFSKPFRDMPQPFYGRIMAVTQPFHDYFMAETLFRNTRKNPRKLIGPTSLERCCCCWSGSGWPALCYLLLSPDRRKVDTVAAWHLVFSNKKHGTIPRNKPPGSTRYVHTYMPISKQLPFEDTLDQPSQNFKTITRPRQPASQSTQALLCFSFFTAVSSRHHTPRLPGAQVYPIGIPIVFAVMLWRKRNMINPPKEILPPGGVLNFPQGQGHGHGAGGAERYGRPSEPDPRLSDRRIAQTAFLWRVRLVACGSCNRGLSVLLCICTKFFGTVPTVSPSSCCVQRLHGK